MEPKKINKYKKCGPEQEIQKKLIDYLKIKDWLVLVTHGNEFQMGLPDLYCAHKMYGTRWIEVKNPVKYHFTPAQYDVFPMLQAKGIGIWVLCYVDEYEYNKLFLPPNWHTFLGKSSMLRNI